MEVLIQQRMQDLSVGIERPTRAERLFFLYVFPDVEIPHHDESGDQYDRQDPEQKDQEAVVAVDRDTVDFASRLRSERSHFCKILCAEADKVPDERRFHRKITEPLNDLSACKLAETGDQE